jgi:hypothetical protein
LNLLTFHKTLAGCKEGSPEAWKGFVASYTPAMLRLLSVYAPACNEEDKREVWQESLRLLCASDFERLRAFDQQSEREFVVDLRAFLLDKVANRLDPAADSGAAPAPEFHALKRLLKGLPLTHQLVVFLKLAGYSDGTLETILRVTPTVAQSGLERLEREYAATLKREHDAGLWPAAWLNLLRYTWSDGRDDCPALRRFVRVLDGQTGWNEKESVEKHVAECLHCLERWAALCEVIYWLRKTTLLPAGSVDVFLSSVPIKADPEARASLLRRMFGLG